MTEPIPLWLDCDPGHDDAFALLLAAHHPSLKLLGVSTVHGNASLAQTTTNAGSVLTAIGRSEVPVYAGAPKPFCRAAVHAPDIHGKSGLDGTDLLPTPQRGPASGAAVQAMADALLKQAPGTAWVVATGALTNVALLFASYPSLAEHVRGVSIMGGAIGGGFTTAQLGVVEGEGERFGNITPWSEFNIYCDPESSHSLLSHPVLGPKTTLITLDLTHLVLATPDVQSRLLNKVGDVKPSDLRQMLHDLLTFFAHTYDSVFGIKAGPPLHDPLAVAVVLETLTENPSSIEGKRFDDEGGARYAVGVVTDGRHAGHGLDGGEGSVGQSGVGQIGRTVIRASSNSQGVRIPKSVDLDWFWNEILMAVDRAETVVKKGAA